MISGSEDEADLLAGDRVPMGAGQGSSQAQLPVSLAGAGHRSSAVAPPGFEKREGVDGFGGSAGEPATAVLSRFAANPVDSNRVR